MRDSFCRFRGGIPTAILVVGSPCSLVEYLVTTREVVGSSLTTGCRLKLLQLVDESNHVRANERQQHIRIPPPIFSGPSLLLPRYRLGAGIALAGGGFGAVDLA